MISFKVTILLAFNLNVVKKKKLDKKKKKKKKKPKAKKKNKKGKKEKKLSVKSKTDSEKKIDENAIPIEEPLGSVHIEYQLLPKFKYKLDVVCWKQVAKIYTSDTTKSFITVSNEKCVWVPVAIEHYLNELTIEELMILKSHLVTFKFFVGKNKLGKAAKTDKTKIFYKYGCNPEDYDSRQFMEVCSKNPNLCLYDDYIYNDIRRIVEDCVNRSTITNEIHTGVPEFLDSAHHAKIEEIIKKVQQNINIVGTGVCPPYESESGPKKGKGRKGTKKNQKKGKKQTSTTKSSRKSTKGSRKSKKSSKTSKKGSDTVQMEFLGELYFTDPNIALVKPKEIDENGVLMNAFLMVTTSHLMSIPQKFQLVPLVIKISKLDNLPENLLRLNGYETISVKSEIPDIVQIRTSSLAINKTVRFNESRFICTRNLPKIKLLQFLQSQRVYFEIIGTKTDGDNETIAIACCDVTSLNKSVWRFVERAQCHNPHSLLYEKQMLINPHYIDIITTNEVNFNADYPFPPATVLTEHILLTMGTMLKIQMDFWAPHYAILHCARLTGTFKRMLLIVFNIKVAQVLLNEIIIHNQRCLGAEMFGQYSGDLFHSSTLNDFDEKRNERLTGFSIDNGDNVIQFIEGPSTGVVQKFFQQLNRFNPHTAKIFYNSDHVFEERLYKEFGFMRGYFLITLNMPLQKIFANKKTYIKGHMPAPCWRAIRKLNLLLKCDVFKTVLQHNLLPNINELLSFNIEFGSRMKWKVPGLDDENLSNASSNASL